MKKFWIVMLAVGLFMAFTVPAFAVTGADLTFSGTYRVRGWYDDNVTHQKPGEVGSSYGTNSGVAFYDNRLRVETTFKVAEGLKLVTRFDALEKMWGRDAYGTSQAAKENGNIFFERAYVSFTTGLGTLNVGYQDWSRFGTQFIDSDETYPGIKYINTFGPLTVLAGVQKRSENRNVTGVNPHGGAAPVVAGNQNYNQGIVDTDSDLYLAGAIFKFKGGEAGFLYEFLNDRSMSQYPSQAATDVAAYRRTIHVFDGYAKYKIGPVYVEAEGVLLSGTLSDNTKLNAQKNVSIENAYGLYLNAEVDLKPAYVGLKVVYTTGDDVTTTDKVEGSLFSAVSLGTDHDFALMIGNYEYFNQVTGLGTAGGTGWIVGTTGAAATGYSMDNLVAWQIYAGFKPTPKIDVRLALTDAFLQSDPAQNAGQPTTWKNRHIGTEVDLRASYKIFDNLTYTIGAGYLFTGEYFKGNGTTNYPIGDDYLLMHQLLLSF